MSLNFYCELKKHKHMILKGTLRGGVPVNNGAAVPLSSSSKCEKRNGYRFRVENPYFLTVMWDDEANNGLVSYQLDEFRDEKWVRSLGVGTARPKEVQLNGGGMEGSITHQCNKFFFSRSGHRSLDMEKGALSHLLLSSDAKRSSANERNEAIRCQRRNDDEVKGFYLWTYGIKKEDYEVHTEVTGYGDEYPFETYNCQTLSTNLPQETYFYPPTVDNMFTVAFSGEYDPTTAISAADNLYQNLGQVPGDKYVSIGGGTDPWSAKDLNALKDAINQNKFSKYQGICYDVEGYSDTGILKAFGDCFAAAKGKMLKNLVTTSHTGPFLPPGPPKDFMEYCFNHPNVDIISPQLYTCDFGTANEYDYTAGFTWDEFVELYNKRTNKNLLLYPSLFMNSLYKPTAGGMETTAYYDLFNTGGTNEGNYPIYFYDQVPEGYTEDKGAKNFFEKILNIGPVTGSIQFANGAFKLDPKKYTCSNDPKC